MTVAVELVLVVSQRMTALPASEIGFEV